MKTRKIWTMCYNPFIMGGGVHHSITTEVGYIEEKSIGKGFRAFSFNTPKGIRIAESITGAIVGDSFESVIEDVKATTKKVMMDQIEEGKKLLEGGSTKKYKREEFFKIYK